MNNIVVERLLIPELIQAASKAGVFNQSLDESKKGFFSGFKFGGSGSTQSVDGSKGGKDQAVSDHSSWKCFKFKKLKRKLKKLKW